MATKMTELCVESEIGRLEQVMLHRPGPEIEALTPTNMSEFLFDDILDLAQFQAEFDTLSRLLAALGVEVVLVREALLAALRPRRDIRTIIETTVELHLADHPEQLDQLDRLRYRLLYEAEQGLERLVDALIEGLPGDEGETSYLLAPLPNLMFTRDPTPVIGRCLTLAPMATPARRRETHLFSLIFGQRFNPLTGPGPAVEGGDLLALHPEILVIGVGHRTHWDVRLPARFILDDRYSTEVVYVVAIPPERRSIHLDTILTTISRTEFLLYRPLISHLQAVRFSRKSGDAGVSGQRVSLLSDLELEFRARSGVEELAFIPAGGSGPRHIQAREQWAEAVNMMALAPGVAVSYDRCPHTLEALAQRGYEVVTAAAVLADEPLAACITTAMAQENGKFIITLPCAELVRGRGGPHCLTMPLRRQPVRWNQVE